MSEMINWVKPDGSEIKTNSNTENLLIAKSLGWKVRHGQAKRVSSILKDSEKIFSPAGFDKNKD